RAQRAITSIADVDRRREAETRRRVPARQRPHRHVVALGDPPVREQDRFALTFGLRRWQRFVERWVAIVADSGDRGLHAFEAFHGARDELAEFGKLGSLGHLSTRVIDKSGHEDNWCKRALKKHSWVRFRQTLPELNRTLPLHRVEGFFHHVASALEDR